MADRYPLTGPAARKTNPTGYSDPSASIQKSAMVRACTVAAHGTQQIDVTGTATSSAQRGGLGLRGPQDADRYQAPGASGAGVALGEQPKFSRQHQG